METRKDISDELKTLSPVVAGLERVNVFTVPTGYFDSVSDTVIACLKESHQILQNREDSAAVPEGYFDNLASSILNKIKAQESALEEIKHLSPLLFSIQHKNVFEVPTGYFENTPGDVTQKIAERSTHEEIAELSPLLYGLKHENVFEVPADYFNNLSGEILQKLQPVTGKVVKMQRRRLFIKYAAAAMMTGVIALGIVKLRDQPPVNTPVAVLDASIEKGRKMNDKQFDEAMKNLSEGDIAKYLETNGDITDVATLGNNLDESELPSQEDYLLDDKTLENYLNKIETTLLKN